MSEIFGRDAKPVNPFDVAMELEGLSGPVADIARSIYMQESGAGKNTKTSNAGAVGGMQIIPSTFSGVADNGWDINDPIHNARAGIRYVKQLHDSTEGDPRLTAIGYYGGPSGIEKARNGIAVSDPRNPNAPNTFQYAQQVLSRIGTPITNSLIPPANAQEVSPPNQPPKEQFGRDAKPVQEQFGRDAQPVKEEFGRDAKPVPQVSSNPFVGGLMGLGYGVGQVGLGTQHWVGKGAKAIGLDQAGNWLINDAQQGRDRLAAEIKPYQDVSPFSTGAGTLAGNIAATWGVGGALGKVAGSAIPTLAKVAPSAVPYTEMLANSLASGGMNLGGRAATTLGQSATNLGLRALGGGITGGVSAGLVNPDDVKEGALIGAAFPVAASGVATGAQALGRVLRGGEISQPVKDLAVRANQLGIDVPADRIANSKPMNALASSLNYVPFSGRAATESKMQEQLNRAVSRTFGQDSDNVTMALRKASDDLGTKFDTVLSSNKVKVDTPLIDALNVARQRAANELEQGQAKIISNQIDEILAKSVNGEIDGQAAYNIKKTLDRLGRQNTPQAYYANDLKKDLMAALNRSLSPSDAAEFAKVRQQYGNMLSLENLAKNGVDGDISIARLANMRNINNKDLQELADISAQFLKPREGQHGAMQRVAMGVLGASVGSSNPLSLAAALAGGRTANSLLNSNMIKSSMMGLPSQNTALANALKQVMPVSSKFLPVLSAQ